MKPAEILEAKQPKHRKAEKEYAVIIWNVGDTIIADREQKGKVLYRYTMDLATAKYKAYRYSDKEWHEYRLDTCCGNQNYYYGSRLENTHDVIVTKDAEKAVEMASQRHGVYSSGAAYTIDRLECNRTRIERQNAEKRRQDRIKALHDKVPEVPADFEKWFFRVSGLDDINYLIWDGAQYRCTSCGKKIKPANIKHLKKTECPKCGKEVTPRKASNMLTVSVDGHAALYQRVDEDTAVIRHFDVDARYTAYGRELLLSESERWFTSGKTNRDGMKKYDSRLYYSQNSRGEEARYWDWKSNPCGRMTFDAYLYPSDFGEILKGTAYEFQKYMLDAVAKNEICMDIGRLAACSKYTETVKYVEMAARIGFQRIIHDAYYKRYYGDDVLNGGYWAKGDPQFKALFEMPKQDRNRVLQMDGGRVMVEWIQWGVRHKKRLNDKTLRWLQDNEISPEVVHTALIYMTPEQIMNYISRQQETYKKKPAQVAEQYEDYLSMCAKLQKVMTDELTYRPKDLKLHHAKAVEEIRKQETLIRALESRDQAEKRAKEIRKKFPHAEEALEKIRERYTFEDGKYMIKVPETLFEIATEGYALHHCVSASDRYYERMEREETYIVFCREKEHPETPFYTIEVEPGGNIRQHRGLYDEEPNLEEVKPFLQKWQRHIRSTMKDDEKQLAAAARKLHEENMEDLLRTKGENDRVYRALLKDYMEVCDGLSELSECV